MDWHSKRVKYLSDDAATFKASQAENKTHKKVAILGSGGNSAVCAFAAKHICGAEVIEVSTPWDSTTHRLASADKQVSFNQLLEVLPECDCFVSALPLTASTECFVDFKTCFSKMKPTGAFMNFGDYRTVNEFHLINALRDNLIASAVLDVTSREPIANDSPLWTLPNVLTQPHLVLERAISEFEANLCMWQEGKF